MKRLCLVISIALGSVAFGGGAEAALLPGRGDWRFDVSFHDPQRLRLRLPGETAETTYWYMIFTVTNNTGKDRPFYPSFRLVTDTLQVVEGGGAISPSVTDAILARHGREYPFLSRLTAVTGVILQGKVNARTSVVVFRDFDVRAARFTIYAAGFSGGIKRIPNPAFDASQAVSDENPRDFHLRRTLAVTYDLPGDPRTRHLAEPVRRTREWVMR